MADGTRKSVDEKITALTSAVEGLKLAQNQQREDIASLHSSLATIANTLAKLVEASTVPDKPGQNSDSILGPPPNGETVTTITAATPAATPGKFSNPGYHRLKFELPMFDGTDVENWLFQLNVYFDFYQVSAEEKIHVACMFMSGIAVTWYRWMLKHGKLTSWQVFVEAIKQRFGPSAFEDYQGQLSKLTQVGSVSEFITDFEKLSDKVPDVSEAMLISMFISGLKSEIQRELHLAKPMTMFMAFDLARVYEAKFADLRGIMKPPWSHYEDSSSVHMPQAISDDTLQGKAFRHLSVAELDERKAQGLCFNCDEKWRKGHKCKHQFHILLVSSDVGEPEDLEDKVILRGEGNVRNGSFLHGD